MVRKSLRMLLLCGCWAAAAGCGASATDTGLTSAFAKAARDAHSYMKSDLVPGIGSPRFPDMLAVSRAKVKIAQTKISGDVDEGVWLILTMVNVKSGEAHAARDMAGLVPPSRAVLEAANDVANERDHCMSEADGWVNGTLQLPVLNAGPCLAQAKLAMSMLKKK